jgi:hypothetical protein
MAKRTLCLSSEAVRERALQAVREAPDGWFVSIGPEGRTEEQSALFHALCDDLARSGVKWAGRPRNARQWKTLLVCGHTTATRDDAELIIGLEGEPVLIRESTASMSKARMASLIEYAYAFCATNGVAVTQQAENYQ